MRNGSNIAHRATYSADFVDVTAQRPEFDSRIAIGPHDDDSVLILHWQSAQQHSIEDCDHRDSHPDAESEYENSGNGERWRAAQSAQR